MSAPDYVAALDLVADASPSDIADLLMAVAAPLTATDIRVYLADFQGIALQSAAPGSTSESAVTESEEVSSSMAGRAYRTGETVTADRGGRVRVWVPLLERGERTGVVALTVPVATDQVLADCVRLGRFAGLLVRSFARTTDLMHVRRRRQSMTLAAGMQWDLLPPLTVRCAEALACGRLEPAYEIAGDAFDYAMNDHHLHAAVFDGMGHGVESTLMTTLAVGAYRHARRGGESIEAMHASIDEAVSNHYHGEAFVTGALARLDILTGTLEWSNAGHPAPLLLRNGRVISELSCRPSLPFGLGGSSREVAAASLEPDDCVLFFTDGVVEGRSDSGDEFGVDRLADAWERQAATHAQPDEVLRRLVEEIVSYNAGGLRDDASLMLLSWTGPRDTRG